MYLRSQTARSGSSKDKLKGKKGPETDVTEDTKEEGRTRPVVKRGNTVGARPPRRTPDEDKEGKDKVRESKVTGGAEKKDKKVLPPRRPFTAQKMTATDSTPSSPKRVQIRRSKSSDDLGASRNRNKREWEEDPFPGFTLTGSKEKEKEEDKDRVVTLTLLFTLRDTECFGCSQNSTLQERT
jgi:hypothetical protein